MAYRCRRDALSSLCIEPVSLRRERVRVEPPVARLGAEPCERRGSSHECGSGGRPTEATKSEEERASTGFELRGRSCVDVELPYTGRYRAMYMSTP